MYFVLKYSLDGIVWNSVNLFMDHTWMYPVWQIPLFPLSLSLLFSDTTFRHTGLTINTPYYYRSAAVNEMGIGEFSNIAILSTSAGTSCPLFPSILLIHGENNCFLLTAYCGDFYCDTEYENCSSCYFDCSYYCGIPSPP